MTDAAPKSAASPRRLAPPDISIAGIAKLASPMFIANVAVLGNVTIDTIMAGRLGAEDLAAVALGGAATGSIIMLLVGIIQGLSPICGHHFGARRFERIGFEACQAAYIAAVLALIGIPLLCWTSFWTDLGQVSGRIAELTSLYLIFSAISVPSGLINRIFVSVNAAISRPRTTMWISLIMLALKAPVNAVFMYGWLGVPAMGGAGAGVSNAIIYGLSTFLFAGAFLKDPACRPMHPARWYAPDFRALKEQLRIGIPIGLSVFFEVSSFTLMAIFISRLGAIAVSAHQIVSNIMATFYMIPLSIGLAASVLVAQSLGAGFPKVAETVSHRTLKIAVAIALTVSTALYFSSSFVIGIYTKEAEVAAVAGVIIACGVVYHPFDAVQAVCGFILRGYRIAWFPMIVSGVALWCFGLGCGYRLGFYPTFLGAPMGPLGFWYGCTAGLILAAAALAAYALLHARKVAKAASS